MMEDLDGMIHITHHPFGINLLLILIQIEMDLLERDHFQFVIIVKNQVIQVLIMIMLERK